MRSNGYSFLKRISIVSTQFNISKSSGYLSSSLAIRKYEFITTLTGNEMHH